MKFITFLFAIAICANAGAQKVSADLTTAINKLEKDDQFAHSIVGMYVAETATGNVVYEHNAQIGFAPASCQKVITSVSAFEFLGKNYRYSTKLLYTGEIKNGQLNGDLSLMGSGDPTFGSWRWNTTKTAFILNTVKEILSKKNIKKITGNIYIDGRKFSYQPTPDGWIWQDIGNYYGAGAWGFNWNENQYDIYFSSGKKLNDETSIEGTSPADLLPNITNLVTTAGKGSGDNVYLYAAPYSNNIFATGTIPLGENRFTVSGSMPNPPELFGKIFHAFLKKENFISTNKIISLTNNLQEDNLSKSTIILDSIVSPLFDSINYWFLKKSINVYGEAFVKTFATNNNQMGSTENGIKIIQQFWKNVGISASSLKMMDGSGLSPANRITPKALVDVLQYAKKQAWFSSFYFDLPEMNGIKMKDGYINGVRSYTGYIKSKTGKEYTFSFVVNNFDGNAGTVREKMWKVLDLLK